MKSYRSRWLNRPGLDYLACLPAVIFFYPSVVEAVSGTKTVFFGAAGGVLALLAAVVTFACTTLYQSQSPRILDARLLFGPELRATWRRCIKSSVICAVLCLLGIPLSAVWAAGSWVLVVGAVLLATARTFRAIAWADVTFAAEDRSLPKPDHSVKHPN